VGQPLEVEIEVARAVARPELAPFDPELAPFDPALARAPTSLLSIDRIVDPLEVTHAAERIAAYRSAMANGDRFPPIAVVALLGRFLVADGHKRFAAVRALEPPPQAIVVELWSIRRWLADHRRQLGRKSWEIAGIVVRVPFDAAARRAAVRLAIDTVLHWRRIGRSLALRRQARIAGRSASRSYARRFVGLTLLCLAVGVPGLRSIPPVDRDEARFAQASRQMAESGDLVVPHFQTAARLQKPAGVYWLQLASARLLGATHARPGRQLLAFRLPSLVAAVFAVLLTAVVGHRLFAPDGAFLGAALLAASACLVVEAHLATADAVLLACVVAAQAALAAIYVARRSGRTPSRFAAAGFWIALALAILVKGPVGPMVCCLTVLSLALADARASRGRTAPTIGSGAAAAAPRPPSASTSSWRATRSELARWSAALRLTWGLPLCLAIALPWMALAGSAFLRDSIGHDVLPKIVAGQESHGLPPGTYLLLSVATFWPGSLFVAPALAIALRRRTRVGERFCLAWLVPSWLLLELFATKLPGYVLPLYPPLALLVGRGVLARRATERARLARLVARLGELLWRGWTVLLGGALVLVPFLSGAPVSAKSAGVAAGGIVLVMLVRLRRARRQAHSAGTAWLTIVAATLVYPLAFAGILPRLDDLWPSRAAAHAIAARENGVPLPVAAAGYAEPSLVFLVGERIQLVDVGAGVDFLAEHTRALLLADATLAPELQAGAARAGVHLDQVWSGSSLSYSKGRQLRLVLLERTR